MAGIGGIFYKNKRPVSVNELATIFGGLQKRGSQSKHVYRENNIGLIETSYVEVLQTKLTTPVVFDGILDNRQELATTLGVHLELPINELILRAYHRWGETFPDKLSGDFSIALWDTSAHKLLLVRDHLGFRPIVYFENSDVFVFASDIETLLRLQFVPAEISNQRIADYIVSSLEGINAVDTFYTSIKRVPPATTFTISGKLKNRQRYWNIDPSNELKLKRPKEYEEALLAELNYAVNASHRNSHNPCYTLSGGLDSSAIVAVATTLSNDPIKALSCTSYDNEYARTESEAITTLGKALPIELTCISCNDTENYFRAVDKLLNETHDLFDTESAHVPLAIYAALAERHTVVNGLDGDLVFNQRSGIIPVLLSKGKLLQALSFSKMYADFYESNTLYELARNGRFAISRSSLLGWAFRSGTRQRRKIRASLMDTPISKLFLEETDLIKRVEGTKKTHSRLPTAREHHIRLLTNPALAAALERYERVGALFHHQSRSPLLRRSIVEFGASLPWDQKFGQRGSKPLMRRALRDQLPAKILTRKNFEHVGNSFCYRYLLSRWDEVLELTSDVKGSYFDRAQLERSLSIVEQMRASTRQHPGTSLFDDSLNVVWKAYMLGRWLSRGQEKSRKSEDMLVAV